MHKALCEALRERLGSPVLPCEQTGSKVALADAILDEGLHLDGEPDGAAPALRKQPARSAQRAVRVCFQALTLDREDTIAKQLLEFSLMRDWERQGTPATRVADFQAADRPHEGFAKVDDVCLAELKEWYKSSGFPEEKKMERGEYAKLLKMVKIWPALPLDELHRQCEQRSVSVRTAWIGDREAQRNQLAQQLLYQDRMDAWEERGFQAKRIGDIDTAAAVVQTHEHINKMSMEELREWYRGCNFPGDQSMDRETIAKLYKKVAIWQSLPMLGLRRDCEDRNLLSSGTLGNSALASGDEEAQKPRLMNILLMREHVESWEAGGIQALTSAHGRHGEHRIMPPPVFMAAQTAAELFQFGCRTRCSGRGELCKAAGGFSEECPEDSLPAPRGILPLSRERTLAVSL